MLEEMDLEDWEEQVEHLTALAKSANFTVREQAQDAIERLNALALAGLVKVGPKGYIHGWIYVGPQAVGSRVFHAAHGHGRVSRSGKRTVGVQFDNGHYGAFEHGHGDGAGTHFAERPGRRRKPKVPAEVKPAAAAKPEEPAEPVKPTSVLGNSAAMAEAQGRINAALAARAAATSEAAKPATRLTRPGLHEIAQEAGIDLPSGTSDALERADRKHIRGGRDDFSAAAEELRDSARSTMRDVEESGLDHDSPEMNGARLVDRSLNRLADHLDARASKPTPAVAAGGVHAKLHEMINAGSREEAERIAADIKGKNLHAALAATPVAQHVGPRDKVDAKRRRLVDWATSADSRNSRVKPAAQDERLNRLDHLENDHLAGLFADLSGARKPDQQAMSRVLNEMDRRDRTPGHSNPLAGQDLGKLRDGDLLDAWTAHRDHPETVSRIEAELSRRDAERDLLADVPEADQTADEHPLTAETLEDLDNWLTRQQAADDDRSRQAARDLAIDSLVAKGWEFRDAYAAVHGLDQDQLLRDERAALVDEQRHLGETREKAVRRLYAEWAYLHWMQAEQDTNGYLLNKRGKAKGIDALSLFSGPSHVARAYASDELKAWWEQHGRRTYTEFRAEMLGRAKDVAAAERIRLAGSGKDFGV